ncbi:polyprenyl synthetase family protein [Streptomyces cinnamoneus]|uniref:polyprenyl synthetase family protein n=1 Tax=Streptomyces cinnamoneus TaxID=53446 RepID=UPI0037894F19
MTILEAATPHIDLGRVRQAVEDTLECFLAGKAEGEDGARIAAPLRVLRDFLGGGGKRVRPLYCCLGWFAVAGRPPTTEVLRAAAGLELFHTFALIHDDVIDGSDSRHARPTAHRAFEQDGPGPRARWFGESAAILLGDLCEVWSAELLGGLSGPSPASARAVLDRMRGELVIGQFLDLRAFGTDFGNVEDALAVIHYKTTKYTVERPLQIGAAMAGASSSVLGVCAAYARPMGEAFQMCDDLEDVLPDPARGDATGNDLREGKHTVVLALALRDAGAAESARLRELVGDPDLDADGLAEAQALIAATGAPRTVRRMVVERRRQALDVLAAAPFGPAARQALARLTDLALPGVDRWEEAEG